MKKNKININNIETDDVKLIKKLIVILIVVVLVIVGFYFFTDKVVKGKEDEQTSIKTDINYDIATVGTMFNRPYDEYYVLVYDSTKAEATYYSTLLSNFESKSDDKIYYVDLSLKENSKYVGEKANKDLTSAEDASFAGTTLLKIKKGKVISYVEGKEEIKEALSK